jgi:hypothetical protein
MKINWKSLLLTVDSTTFSLGLLVEDAMNGRDTLGELTLTADGAIREWPQVLVHAEGQEPAWDSLQSLDVDWTGFEAAVENARATEAAMASA